MLAPNLYETALRGEPLDRTVVPPLLDMSQMMWTIGEWRILLPMPDVRPAPETQRMVRELRNWTGWSQRRLAQVLVTSHTTVGAIESGRTLIDGQSGDLRRRLQEAHDVIKRVYILAEQDSSATAAVLDASLQGRHSAVEELRAGDPGRAYLAVVDIVRPRRTGLITGDRTRGDGAIVALHD